MPIHRYNNRHVEELTWSRKTAGPDTTQSWLIPCPCPIPFLTPRLCVPSRSFQAALCLISACPPLCGHHLVPQPISSFSPRRSGLVRVKNPHLDLMEEDILYHLDLGTKTHNLPAMFGDIKVKSRCKSKAAAPPCTGSPAVHLMVLSAHAGAPLLPKLLLGLGLAAQLRDSAAQGSLDKEVVCPCLFWAEITAENYPFKNL